MSGIMLLINSSLGLALMISAGRNHLAFDGNLCVLSSPSRLTVERLDKRSNQNRQQILVSIATIKALGLPIKQSNVRALTTIRSRDTIHRNYIHDLEKEITPSQDIRVVSQWGISAQRHTLLTSYAKAILDDLSEFAESERISAAAVVLSKLGLSLTNLNLAALTIKNPRYNYFLKKHHKEKQLADVEGFNGNNLESHKFSSIAKKAQQLLDLVKEYRILPPEQSLDIVQQEKEEEKQEKKEERKTASVVSIYRESSISDQIETKIETLSSLLQLAQDTIQEIRSFMRLESNL